MRRAFRNSVFLNIPYDDQYADLYQAFIAALCAFGLVPRATLEIPSGERRLDRIFNLMKRCHYSIHDLSRVQLDRNAPRTPRFNMPFELGLLVGWQRTARSSHKSFVFESARRRLQKSLSDLDGTDPLIHNGNVTGVFRELSNVFVKNTYPPTVQQMHAIYRHVRSSSPGIMRSAGATSLFGARVFEQLVVLATTYAQRTIPGA